MKYITACYISTQIIVLITYMYTRWWDLFLRRSTERLWREEGVCLVLTHSSDWQGLKDVDWPLTHTNSSHTFISLFWRLKNSRPFLDPGSFYRKQNTCIPFLVRFYDENTLKKNISFSFIETSCLLHLLLLRYDCWMGVIQAWVRWLREMPIS